MATTKVTTDLIADATITTAKLASTTGSGAVVLATSPTLTTPALGTPSALVGTNITGTAAAFNINGTVGATTPAAGAFTTLSSTTGANLATSSGNVGIGTASPGAALDVSKGATGTVAMKVRNTTSGTGNAAQLSIGMDNDADNLYLQAFSSTFTTAGMNVAAGALINGEGPGGLSVAATQASIRFYTNGSTAANERMRIDSSGGLMVNTTSMTAAEQMGLWYSSNNGPGLTIRDTAAQNGNTFIRFSNGATAAGSITTNGTTSTSYGTSSDYRMKENIQLMSNTLEKVLQLKPCTYNWKQEFGGSSGQGFIAHELQAIVPDCVTGEKDAVDADGKPIHQGIDTSFLVATLTAAIQELKAIIDTQAAQITALNAKVGI